MQPNVTEARVKWLLRVMLSVSSVKAEGRPQRDPRQRCGHRGGEEELGPRDAGEGGADQRKPGRFLPIGRHLLPFQLSTQPVVLQPETGRRHPRAPPSLRWPPGSGRPWPLPLSTTRPRSSRWRRRTVHPWRQPAGAVGGAWRPVWEHEWVDHWSPLVNYASNSIHGPPWCVIPTLILILTIEERFSTVTTKMSLGCGYPLVVLQKKTVVNCD